MAMIGIKMTSLLNIIIWALLLANEIILSLSFAGTSQPAGYGLSWADAVPGWGWNFTCQQFTSSHPILEKKWILNYGIPVDFWREVLGLKFWGETTGPQILPDLTRDSSVHQGVAPSERGQAPAFFPPRCRGNLQPQSWGAGLGSGLD